MEHVKSQFRVTPWPGTLPHPQAPPGFDYELREGVFVGPNAQEVWAEARGDVPPLSEDEFRERVAKSREPARSQLDGRPRSDRFDEIYLQLMLVDLDDEAAVVSWVNEFGLLEIHEQSIFFPLAGPPGNPYERVHPYPLFDDVDESFLLAFIADQNRCRHAAGFRGSAVEQSMYPVTLEEFTWGAACIRDLARSYWCLSTGAAPASLTWDNPLIMDSFRADNEHGGWWTPLEMEYFVVDTLQAGLAGFSPRVVPDDRVEKPIAALRGRERSTAMSEQFYASNDLFAICCLELFNHIAEGAIYRTCANETCGRWFVRQQGRAAHDQRRRSGVRFCSYACARQQTQRNHRRRRRPEA